jgi:hypothetical protein
LTVIDTLTLRSGYSTLASTDREPSAALSRKVAAADERTVNAWFGAGTAKPTKTRKQAPFCTYL